MDPMNISKDLVRFSYHDKEDMFDAVSYNKGGGILHMLRNYLGDEAFFAGLNDYLKTNEYGTGEAHQIRLSLEKVSGKDLNWFFNQWFFGKGHPKLDVKYTYEPVKKQVTVHINQTGDFFEFPLTIDVYEGSKANRHQVWAEAKAKNMFTFNFNQKPDLVNVNADGVLLADIKDDKTPEQYLHQYLHSKDLKSRLSAIQNAKENIGKNPAALKTLLAALKDPYHQLRIEAIDKLDLKIPEVSKATLSELEKIANTDPKTLVQAKAIAKLAETKDKKYLPIFEKGLNSISNSVKGNSVFGISNVAPERLEGLITNIDLSSAKEDLIMVLIPVIVEKKIDKHMPAIASTVAFYPFIGFQNPELAKPTEEGFNWIMDSDNTKAVENLTKILHQAKSQIGNNPQVKMMIVNMLKGGLDRKMNVLKSNPKSESLNKQIELLNKAMEAYK